MRRQVAPNEQTLRGEQNSRSLHYASDAVMVTGGNFEITTPFPSSFFAQASCARGVAVSC
jgi:hypothetical protein